MPPELMAVQAAIQALHDLMTVLDDPKDTQIVSKCLTALTGIQNEMMTSRPQSAAQSLVSQLQGGGPGGGGPGGGGGGQPDIGALLAALGGGGGGQPAY